MSTSNFWRLGFLSLLLVAAVSPASIAWANKAAPAPPSGPKDGVPLEVVRQKEGATLRLEIPRDLLAKDSKTAGIFGGLDGGRTIVAGLALSLSIIIGGLWLVRRFSSANAKPLGKAATAGLLVTLVVCGGTLAWANAPPPALKKKLEAGSKLRLDLVIVERGDKVVLRGSDAELTKLLDALEVLSSEEDFGTKSQPVPAEPKK